jgi:hypothetical protein
METTQIDFIIALTNLVLSTSNEVCLQDAYNMSSQYEGITREFANKCYSRIKNSTK